MITMSKMTAKALVIGRRVFSTNEVDDINGALFFIPNMYRFDILAQHFTANLLCGNKACDL